MNIRFVMRVLSLALPLVVVVSAVALVASAVRAVVGLPPDPTPPPPTILAPRGELPRGNVAFQEWVRFRDAEYQMVGCGFLMALGDGRIVGLTAAHNAMPGNPMRPLEQIRLRAQPAGYTVDFERLYLPPGRPRDGDDLTVDYLVLHPEGAVDPAYVLQPDPRGGPLPGERVALYKCLGGDGGGQSILSGTVQSVSDKAMWVLMDEPFSPMHWSGSGSPLLSQHTGQVVGMLIAGTLRGRWMLLGMHPVGSLVQKAATATSPLLLKDYVLTAQPAEQ
ncbi:MAG: serine protease [Anaerolineae bacterium]|nr:serine protease [Anaerolineae bacterium]MDW8072327.1 hypothetical protein [Anaerolineae bacterium]